MSSPGVKTPWNQARMLLRAFNNGQWTMDNGFPTLETQVNQL
ncbi:hypothetical protein CWATWH0402_2394 [Crocosphaera watsonii WH 0402]|uniref:Uncharacterized protein n=4 Tax=Crocosphaera watsonii TaxID=263511 RepID=T2JMN1_CROWT|nr:hypothetical protein CWATWH0003_1739 [Crocosphaera watsonii WH 0003]CCQ58536.1 hypothetical protein CWATWH0005_1752 [Crocosphaera watsonii WH 0005]CCQ59728.1 hypothetical protein CWATWH0401_295 [Crocosphaera watsonii WH 0401]CCQ65787.1 hypothetical protein CWATWH0402_2394 [Crocosphaera watsonii WH 0402]